MTDREPTKPARPRTLRIVLAVVGVALVLAAALTWANRRTLAREALVGWLRSRGVAAEAEVEAIGLSTFVASLRIGDPANPDFTAERVEVRYRTGLGAVELTSIVLKKPVLRASVRGGKFSVGSLDPIVKEILSRPPPPKAARIEEDDGVLALATDYGAVRLTADALMDDNRLQRLSATSAPARLKGQDFDVALGAGAIKANLANGQVQASLAAPFSAARVAAGSARDGQLTLSGVAPYPDLQKRRLEGPLILNAQVAARGLDAGGRKLESANLSAALIGRASGALDTLAVSGKATANLVAGAADLGQAGVQTIRMAAASDDLRWTRAGGDRVAATLRLNGGLGGVRAGGLRFTTLTGALSGPVTAGIKGVTANLTGSAVGQGGWTGLGAPTAADSAEMKAVRRAARAFRVVAPELSLRMTDGLTVGLPKPAVLLPSSGGEVRLAARSGGAVFGPDGGAFRLNVSGGGLPRLEADIARLAITDTGLDAQGRLTARASIGVVEGGEVDASGRLVLANGGLAFTADRCVTVKAAKLELGANDIEAPSGRFCPARAPLFSLAGADWKLSGRYEAATVAAPFAEVRMEGGAGRLTATSTGGRLAVQAQVSGARLEDTAPQARFTPMMLSGDARLANYVWTADLALRPPGGARIGAAHLVHDGGLGVGFVTLDSGLLTFAEGGLQPGQLSPMAGAIGSPVVGSARFEGRFDWARSGAGSSGTLTIPSLDFQSPAGPVTGLKGTLAFTSLAPLVAAPGQSLTVEKVQAIVLLEHLRADFGVADNVLTIAGGEAQVGGGRVRIEKLELPLTPGAPTRGVLFFEGVQLHDLVEASPFGDKVEFDAKVSGRVPFEANGNQIRITGGNLKADQPGRISIDRTALTGVQAEGTAALPAVADVDPNATFTDFAYQAMEHLAFDRLEAAIESRDNGRLGVLFTIVGRHDPPEKQRIRLTIMDLIQQRFLGRKLPLPSGTGVNLTLDTSVNLDDLLSDYFEYQRLSGSRPVQP